MYSCFVKICKRENVDPSLYMCIDGTIDERDDAKEKKERREEKRREKKNQWTVAFFLSASFVLKWTNETWVIDNDDDDDVQATS